MNHGEGHPCEHAVLQCDRDTKNAIAGQIARLEELKAQLGQLPASSPEAQTLRREAIRIVNQLYEQCKATHCSCRISSWYYQTSVALGAPMSWTPL